MREDFGERSRRTSVEVERQIRRGLQRFKWLQQLPGLAGSRKVELLLVVHEKLGTTTIGGDLRVGLSTTEDGGGEV